jgi:hypothetical protein
MQTAVSRIRHMVASHRPFTVQTFQVQGLGSLWYGGYCNLCIESPVNNIANITIHMQCQQEKIDSQISIDQFHDSYLK